MFTNALCKSLKHLGITAKRAIAVRYCSTQTSTIARSVGSILFNIENGCDRKIYEPTLRLSRIPSPILDNNFPRNPLGRIHEFPVDNKAIIGEPPRLQRRQEDSTADNKSLDLPTNGEVSEKRAVTAIVIRRRKMRRHKLKKLRKRMKFYWAKIKQRREMKKERAFHAELLGKIKKSNEFDAERYVASLFEQLSAVRLPNKYRGVPLPEAQMREFLERDRIKLEKKRNKPRLTL